MTDRIIVGSDGRKYITNEPAQPTIGCVQHDCEKCKALEAQVNTCGSSAGCLHKDAKIEALEVENADLRMTPAEDVLLRNATLRAGKKIEKPDCRTCLNRYNGDIIWLCDRDCTNGDQYQPAPAVVLWRTE